MWLLTGLRPRYKTIADFRKNHCKAFREVFRRFVYLLKQWDLIEGETVAIDSFKIRASNSLKNNFNENKLKRHLEYIDARIKEYEDLLDTCDREEDRNQIKTKLAERKEKRAKYQRVKRELAASDQEQISLTDPDSRAVVLTRNIVNVGYNIQASSDAKHKFLLEYETGSINDTHSLGSMATRCIPMAPGTTTTTIEKGNTHSGFNGTLPLNARVAQAGIYVQRAKATAGILIGVNMQR